MQLLNIANRLATIEFEPEDCALIAQYLRESENDEADRRRRLFALAALFEACAFAAGIDGYLTSNVQKILTLENMRAGKMLDPISAD